MPKLSNKKKPCVGVELRAGGDLHRSEKPGWKAGDMRWWPKNSQAFSFSHESFVVIDARSSHPRSNHLKSSLTCINSAKNYFFWLAQIYQDNLIFLTCPKPVWEASKPSVCLKQAIKSRKTTIQTQILFQTLTLIQC